MSDNELQTGIQNKPPKKKPKTIRAQCAEDMEDFKQQITDTFTSKFDRLEQAIAAMAANQSRPQDSSRDQPNLQQQRSQEQSIAGDQSNKNPNSSNSQNASSARSFNVIDKDVSFAMPQQADPARTLIEKEIPHNPRSTSRHQNEAMALTQDNNNEPSPAWIISQALGTQQPNHQPTAAFLPTSAVPGNYDEEVEAKVNHILTTTAHQLASGPGKTGLFPHKYISWGPDRKRPGFNMLSLSEHVWGIFMLMKEQKVPLNTKPLLYKHIQNIVEDACMFDWTTAVRPWSEEVFSQVNEGRLTWDDSASIQMLRMSMSRTTVAKIDPATGSVIKHAATSDRRNNTQTYEIIGKTNRDKLTYSKADHRASTSTVIKAAPRGRAISYEGKR